MAQWRRLCSTAVPASGSAPPSSATASIGEDRPADGAGLAAAGADAAGDRNLPRPGGRARMDPRQLQPRSRFVLHADHRRLRAVPHLQDAVLREPELLGRRLSGRAEHGARRRRQGVPRRRQHGVGVALQAPDRRFGAERGGRTGVRRHARRPVSSASTRAPGASCGSSGSAPASIQARSATASTTANISRCPPAGAAGSRASRPA
jgi:hypothetical protein